MLYTYYIHLALNPLDILVTHGRLFVELKTDSNINEPLGWPNN